MIDSDKAWLAGLLEGEGHFGISSNGRKEYFKVIVKMTNSEVIDRVASLFDRKPHRVVAQKPGWNDQYCVQIKGTPAVKLAREIYPWLSTTRRIQIRKALVKCGRLPA
jgi:hypothetical protein